MFQALLGDDQYVFTRLNKIYDNMPSSESLNHMLFPRAPTPLEGTFVLKHNLVIYTVIMKLNNLTNRFVEKKKENLW